MGARARRLAVAAVAVTAVESGERAHSLLREQHVDCLLTDLRVPDLRGDVLFELARSIQPHLCYRTLITTGDASESTVKMLEPCNAPC